MKTIGLRLWRISEHTDLDLVRLRPNGYMYLVRGPNAMRLIPGKCCSPYSGNNTCLNQQRNPESMPTQIEHRNIKPCDQDERKFPCNDTGWPTTISPDHKHVVLSCSVSTCVDCKVTTSQAQMQGKEATMGAKQTSLLRTSHQEAF